MSDLRCDCGSLLARVVGESLQLKCRRCRRLLAIAAVSKTWAPVRCGDQHEARGDQPRAQRKTRKEKP